MDRVKEVEHRDRVKQMEKEELIKTSKGGSNKMHGTNSYNTII